MSATPLYDEIRRRYLLMDDMPEPEVPYGRHALRALHDDEDQAEAYVYTDPVDDPAWRRISAPDPDDVPDAFPPDWGTEPTERDQAAIDAGNA